MEIDGEDGDESTYIDTNPTQREVQCRKFANIIAMACGPDISRIVRVQDGGPAEVPK